MPIGNIISSIFSKATSAVVDSVGNALDKNFTSKEEKEKIKLEIEKEVHRHFEAIAATSNRELELELADMDSARNREIQIVTSEKAPLINKIIQPILALLILGSCFIFWYMMLYVDIPTNKEVQVAGITGALTTLSMGVVSYFFGSSTGSRDKAEQIKKLMN